MTKDLTEGNPLKLIFNFTIPIVIGMLFQQIYSMADAAIVGKYLGKEALAAVGSTGSINFLLIGFVTGTCGGFTVPIAHKFGAKDEEGLRKTIANSAGLSMIISILMVIVTTWLCRWLLETMQTPANIMDGAYKYIVIILAGIPATFLYNMTAGIIRSIGDSKTPVYFLMLASVINIVLDIYFIVILGMHVEGAAIATVISQLIAGLLCLVYMIKKYEILHIRREEWKLEAQIAGNLCSVGIPMGLQYSVTAIGNVILQSALNGLGSDPVAAFTAGSKLFFLLICPFESIGTAMATYAGQNVGAKKLERISEGVKSAFAIGMIFAMVSLALIWFYGPKLLLLFLSSGEKALIADAQKYILFNVLAFMLLNTVCVFRFTIQGMGFGSFAIWAGAFEMAARIVSAWVLVPWIGYTGVCLGTPLAWLFASVFLIPAYFYCKKKL